MNTIKDLRDIIRAGGSTEGETGSKGINNLQVFTEEDTGKQSLYPDANSIPDSGASISFNNETGKITVTIPSKWQNDEEVKQYTNSDILKTISSNYKANKDVTYKDPYDESKQIKTDEWISRYNDALRFRINTLNAYKPTISQIVERHGGTEAKNAAINKMGTKDIIIMSLDYKNDDSLVPLPKYMILAYPELKTLSSFSSNEYGDFVSKKDFLENFYNIESGKINEKLAYGIATAPKKVLEKIEDMDASEIAKTIGFGNFIKGVDPKRSNWDQFLQVGNALYYGFKGGMYDWFVDTSNLISNFVNFSWLNGNRIDTRDFFDGVFGTREGMDYVSPSEELTRYMEQMAVTNKDALTKAQVGYVEGKLAGLGIDLVVQSMFMTDVSNAIMRTLIKSGSNSLVSKMAEAANAATGNNTGYTYGPLSPRVYSQTEKASDYQRLRSLLSDVTTRGERYNAFFNMTLGEALRTYNNAAKGTAASLNVLGSAQLANIVNSAAELANGLKWANTAMSVLGSVVISAVVSNKELTTKVLSSDATSDEVKSWVSNIIFDTAKMQVWGYALGYTSNLVKSADLYPELRELAQKASQKVMKFTESISNPWVNFMEWYLNNKAAKARATGKAMSNSAVASREAVKDAVLTNEMIAYGSNLSTKPGSNGTKLIEQYLKDNPYIKRGATISETMQNIVNAGVAIDPGVMGLSEFEAWKADFVEVENYKTYSRDFQQKLSIVVKELNNKDIEPIISAQLSQYNKSNAKLLRAEKRAGLITKEEYKISNKSLKEEGGINAMHSKESAVYAVRLYESEIIRDKALASGYSLESLNDYAPYTEAIDRLNKAAANLPKYIQSIIKDEILPELRSVERLIVDRMVGEKIYSKELIDSARNSGEYGENGVNWVRLVARKEMSKGTYTPFDKTVEEDHTVAYGRFKVLDDDDITWVGNGLAALEIEYATKLDRRGYEAMKRATNQTTDIVMSGKKTAAMRKIKEYDSDLKKAIKQGVSSFVETSKGTVAIGKTRARMQSEFYEKVSVTGAIASMDIDALRNVLREKGLPLSENITDQASFEKYYDECDQYAKALIDDVVGSRGNEFKTDTITHFGQMRSEFDSLVEFRDSIKDDIALYNRQKQDLLDIKSSKEKDGEPLEDINSAIAEIDGKIASAEEDLRKIEDKMLDEKNWPEFWKKSSKRAKEMIREQLKSTSLQTGYGIKGQILERLNAQVPGFNILDWSLLYREHTNGLVKGGLYSGMDNSEVKAYIFDIDDLIDLLGYDTSPLFEDGISIVQNINTIGKNAVLPGMLEKKTLKGGVKYDFKLKVDQARGHYDWNWEDYLKRLKAAGFKKVPVAIYTKKAKNVPSKIEEFIEKSGKSPRDITSEMQVAFEENGKIPFFHSQNANYGSMEFNDASRVPKGDDKYTKNNGIGDAYWLSPNASYTDNYGSTKLAGNIPVKYFMSDKERASTLDSVKKELAEYNKKIENLGKEEIKKSIKPVGKTRFVEKEWNRDGLASKGFFVINVNKKPTYVDLSGATYKAQKAKVGEVRYLVPTGKNVKLPKDFVDNHIGDVEGYKNLGRSKLTRKEKNELAKLEKIFLPSGDVSYRALAEYTKKPVIDISIPMQNMPGVRADGTAFFYYKGISPKFDDMLNEQLGIQKAGTPSIDDSEEKLAGYLADLNDISVDEILENIYAINNVSYPNEYWIGIWEAENAGEEISEEDLNNAFDSVLDEISGKYPNTAEMLRILWSQNGPTTDLGKLIITPKLAAGADKNPEVKSLIVGFLKETDNLPAFDYTDPTEEGRSAWNAIDPRSGNIPDTPVFKAPKGDVEFGDINSSIEASGTDFRADLFRAIDSERFNNLIDFRNKSSDKYELLLEKLDRANAANNEDVKNSMQVQAAAEQYKETIKDLENTVVLTNKLSYLTEVPAPAGSLQEYAKNNNISYGKNIKEDVKNALWEKLINGEEIPEIKGLHIKNIQKDIAAHAEVEKATVTPAKAADGEIEALEDSVKAFEEEIAETTDEKELSRLKKELDQVKKDLERAKAADEAAKNDIIPSDEVQKINDAFYKDLKNRFFAALDKTELFKSPSGPNVHKYEVDREMLLNDINEAFNDMISRIRMDGKAMAALRGIAEYYGVGLSDERIEFIIIGEILGKDGGKYFGDVLDKLAEDIFNGLVHRNSVIIVGNMEKIKSDIKKAIMEAFEFRFGLAKGALESRGEPTFSEASTELLQKYASDIKKAKEDKLVVKTTDENGEYQWERVSPSIAGIYNEKPIYTPMSTAMQIWANLSLIKKISTTDLRLGSISKQLVSDPTMSFITIGALPGTLNALRNEIIYTYGESMLQALEKSDPIRYANIQEIAKRENISEKEALKRNIKAIEKVQLPFTYLNSEVLRQFSTSKYGNEVSLELQRKTNGQKINSFLRKIADKFGFIQNTREQYFRLIAGEKARLDALKLGYNVYQANSFAEYAINTATTNFRLKLMMFNKLRSTVPYATAGISGAKSFWRMFMLDPIGVSSRIYTGFICPIMYFMGDIFVNRELREKYKTLSESEKDNHIIIAVGGELMSVPVGEEMGSIVNLVRNVVETMYDMGSHEFWKLMLNDTIGLLPGLDLTGFTDPEMMDAVTSGTASVADLLESGAGKVLAGTTPPLVQTIFMINTGRDLYTGNKINNSYWSIDDEGRAVRMSSSTSQFAQAMAKYIGGDAKVIEKSVSGTLGIVPLILLDSITSAVEYFATGGKEGSLTTIVDKAMSDISKPFTYYGYDDLDKQWNFGKNELFDKKRQIEERGDYKEYNENIAKEKDPEKRKTMINNRNELFHDYFEQVRLFIDNYKKIGGTLNRLKFSQAVSLLTFEDAVRSDRQFMDINTDYYDARDKAMQTLYSMGITNPEGPSSLGYIYMDSQGKAQLKMWNPVQMQIIQDEYYAQGDLHAACIKAIINDGTENSISNLAKKESEAEDPYWEKFYANGRKLSNADWDALDEIKKEFNAKVVVALQNYMNTYGAANVLSNSSVIDYLDGIIKVPSSYERINGRYISSGGGKLNKSRGFAPSYIKSIFGVK